MIEPRQPPPGLSQPNQAEVNSPAEFARWLESMRPSLHRYCARMTGSTFDGEDAVQDTLLKAMEAYDKFANVEQPSAWLYRIAHNAVTDLLRRRAHHVAYAAEEEMELIPDDAPTHEERHAAQATLKLFMHLTPIQRSCVILMDVLGYSLGELCDITGSGLPAVKSSLRRGRMRLQQVAQESMPSSRRKAMNPAERALLTAYTERFNAREFGAIRDMLAEEVRLDLVARTRMKGRTEVGTYLHNYSGSSDWLFRIGWVEGRPAAIVSDPSAPDVPTYFVVLQWESGKVAGIRDFRYARYATELAEIEVAARA